MARSVRRILMFLSPTGRTGKRVFIIIFLCAVFSAFVIYSISSSLCYKYDPIDGGGLVMGAYLFFGTAIGMIGLILGLVPLNAYYLVSCTYDAICVIDEYSYAFLVEAVVVDILYVLYVFQCIRRCRDMGKAWWWSFIPFFNPWRMCRK